MTVGRLEIDPAGNLRPIDRILGAAFAVRWQGWRVEIALTETTLTFRAVPGRVPSTSGAAGAQRPEVLETLTHLPALLPDGWCLSLAPDHRVIIGHEHSLTRPATACKLITATTDFLLELAPYCTVLAEAGVEPPAGLAGSVNV